METNSLKSTFECKACREAARLAEKLREKARIQQQIYGGGYQPVADMCDPCSARAHANPPRSQ